MEEGAASGEVAALYQRFRTEFGRPEVPGILKCYATHPPLLRSMMDLSQSFLFTDGHLARRHKEMIATFISMRNDCSYCADKDRERINWKLLTDLSVRSRQDAVEKLTWYAQRWKIET